MKSFYFSAEAHIRVLKYSRRNRVLGEVVHQGFDSERSALAATLAG